MCQSLIRKPQVAKQAMQSIAHVSARRTVSKQLRIDHKYSAELGGLVRKHICYCKYRHAIIHLSPTS